PGALVEDGRGGGAVDVGDRLGRVIVDAQGVDLDQDRDQIHLDQPPELESAGRAIALTELPLGGDVVEPVAYPEEVKSPAAGVEHLETLPIVVGEVVVEGHPERPARLGPMRNAPVMAIAQGVDGGVEVGRALPLESRAFP